MYVYMNLYVYVYVTIYLSSNYLSMIYFVLAPFWEFINSLIVATLWTQYLTWPKHVG